MIAKIREGVFMDAKIICDAYKILINHQVDCYESETNLDKVPCDERRVESNEFFSYFEKNNVPNFIVLKDRKNKFYFLPLSEGASGHSIFEKYRPLNFHLKPNNNFESQEFFIRSRINGFESANKEIKEYEFQSKSAAKAALIRNKAMGVIPDPKEIKKTDFESEIRKLDPIVNFDDYVKKDKELRKVEKGMQRDGFEAKAKDALTKIGVLDDRPFRLLNLKNDLIDSDLSNMFTHHVQKEDEKVSETYTETTVQQGNVYGYNVEKGFGNSYNVTPLKTSGKTITRTKTASKTIKVNVLHVDKSYLPYFEESLLTKEEKQSLDDCWKKTLEINKLLDRYSELGFFKISEKSSITKQIDALINEQNDVVARLIVKLSVDPAKAFIQKCKKAISKIQQDRDELKEEVKSKNIYGKDIKEALIYAADKQISAFEKMINRYSSLVNQLSK